MSGEEEYIPLEDANMEDFPYIEPQFPPARRLRDLYDGSPIPVAPSGKFAADAALF